MQLNFGILINMLDFYINGDLQTSAKKMPSYEMAGMLLDSFLLDKFYSDETQQITVNRYINCGRKIPKDVKKSLNNEEYNDDKVLTSIKNIIRYMPSDDMLKYANKLINCILTDDRINNSFVIYDDITKGNISSQSEIICELLTKAVLLFVLKNDNDTEDAKNALSEAVRNMSKNEYSKIKKISGYYKELNLSETIATDDFKNLFFELNPKIAINTDARSNLQLYFLNPKYNKFDITGIGEFIDDNVCEYALSRIEYKNYDLSNLKKMARDVRKRILDNSMNNKAIIDEIILYYILEKKLHAPKVMTKLEFLNHGDEILSSSIHLRKISNKTYEFIYAEPMSDENYINSIESIFDKIELIINDKTHEFAFLSKINNMNETLSSEDASIIRDILLKKAYVAEHNIAFSIFIGYTYKETKCYADPFTKHFREQLNIDASKIGEKINQKIEKLGLWNLSFYIYIIPFNSVEEEFKEFLKVQDL